MSHRHPPKLAAWLLRRSGIAAQNSPLAGDLIEEFQHGRSSAWFWRQTLKAIGTSWVLDVRSAGSYGIAIHVGWAIQAGITILLWTSQTPTKTWWIWSLIVLSLAGFLPVKTSKATWLLERVLVAVNTGASTLLLYFIIHPGFSLTGLILFELTWLVSDLIITRKLARTRRSRSI